MDTDMQPPQKKPRKNYKERELEAGLEEIAARYNVEEEKIQKKLDEQTEPLKEQLKAIQEKFEESIKAIEDLFEPDFLKLGAKEEEEENEFKRAMDAKYT
jgi:hypothetical protein